MKETKNTGSSPIKRKRRRHFSRRKICRFCADKGTSVHYRDINTLRLFITERGKIIPRRISGNCARHQREISTAIKRARQIALLPYSSTTL